MLNFGRWPLWMRKPVYEALAQVEDRQHPRVPVYRNMRYGELPWQRYDAYASGGGQRQVVLYHGGSWINGDKAHPREVWTAHWLAEHGFEVLVPHWGSDWSQMREDFAAWDRIAPNRYAVIGHSSGGHMALYQACTNPRVSRAVNLYGICNTLYHDAAREFLGEDMVSACPMSYVMNGPVAPVLTLHGSDDKVVPIGEAEALHRDLNYFKRENRLIEVAAGHSFTLRDRPELQEAVLGWLSG